MAILAKSVKELQENLNLLYTYCNKWGLEVNTSKTKVMVFRKRGQLKENEKWIFNDKELDVVNDFNYLGTVFNYTGNFSRNQEHLVGKALRALSTLLYNCKHLNFKPSVLCQLFDAFVGSTLGYASEIWGYSKSKEIERIHLKFCKQVLGVRKNTCTAGIYGELGRYPLFINRYVRIIKYWGKLIFTDNIILKTLYNEALININNGHNNWLSNVKKLLYEHGFAYAWDSPELVNHRHFHVIFKQRLVDCFIQSWQGSKETSSVLDMYNNFKTVFVYEPYLDILPFDLRIFISRIRLSSNSLRIQTGRYSRNRIVRNERYCLCCDTTDIEDEYHFILICSCYSDLRMKYIRKHFYERPSVIKFLDLVQSNNKKELTNLSIFVKKAFNHRISILNN